MKNQSKPVIPQEPNARRAWVKYQLELLGYSYVDLAQELKCTRQCIQKAVTEGNQRVQRFVAAKLGFAPEEIWPERYDEYGTPLRFRGRARKVDTTTNKKSIPDAQQDDAA